jgi:hypothetical protein
LDLLNRAAHETRQVFNISFPATPCSINSHLLPIPHARQKIIFEQKLVMQRRANMQDNQ